MVFHWRIQKRFTKKKKKILVDYFFLSSNYVIIYVFIRGLAKTYYEKLLKELQRDFYLETFKLMSELKVAGSCEISGRGAT